MSEGSVGSNPTLGVVLGQWSSGFFPPNRIRTTIHGAFLHPIFRNTFRVKNI
ncbi:MAG: hypothetical protein ACFFDF_12410 [Candidatus Odinarchaeota archaeon]